MQIPKSFTLVQGRCLMDPNFSHFGETIKWISLLEDAKTDFEQRCENEFTSGILTLDCTFWKKKDLAPGRCVAG